MRLRAHVLRRRHPSPRPPSVSLAGAGAAVHEGPDGTGPTGTGTRTAVVRRSDRFWTVEVEGVGTTRARHLALLEEATADLIEVSTGRHAPELAFEVHLPDGVAGHLHQARHLRGVEAVARTRAAAEVDAAAHRLRQLGVSNRDVARLLAAHKA